MTACYHKKIFILRIILFCSNIPHGHDKVLKKLFVWNQAKLLKMVKKFETWF